MPHAPTAPRVRIDAIVTDGPADAQTELAEIDENLCRAELTDAERAAATARRKVIYEGMHPETGHGKAGPNKDAKLASFVNDTASKTGQSKRAVARDAARGEKVAPEVLNEIRGTDLDKGVVLDRLAKVGVALRRICGGIHA